jgi:lambda family phage portal protein
VTQYVETPRDSRWAGLILPREEFAAMVRHEVGAAYQSVRRDNKNTAAWDTSMGSADADTLPYRAPLAYQARDLDRNNPLAAGGLDTIVDNVVATGLRPQSSIDRAILGLSEEEASKWQTEAERFFFMWADSPNSDATRYGDFWTNQGVALLNALLSGDVFPLRRYKERPGSVFGTCIQLIEGDRCATPPELEAHPSRRVFDGVEVDADGEPVRYHFLRRHPGDIFLPGRAALPHEYVSVPALDERGDPLCLHLFLRRRPEQKRGVSILAPVIEQFKQLGRYTEAELTAAVVSGMFAVFVKTETPSQGFGVLPGGIPGQVGGQQITPKGTGLTRLQSGAIVDLAPNESIEVANPNRPNTAFDPFTAGILKHIGVGLGLPYEVLVKHFTASYSASRAAILEAWKTFRRRRQWLVSAFCQPVYGWVISEAVARGYLSAPGFFDDPLRRAAWLGATWRGAPAGQLDPLREAKAAREWLSIPGATTIQNVAAEYFGNDYEDCLQQTKREREAINALPPDPLKRNDRERDAPDRAEGDQD